MDPRMFQRRRNVAEERARYDVRRVVWLVALLASIGSAVWLVTSPLLSVRTVTVFGATHAEVEEILVEQRVVEGRPLVAIRSGSVAEALAADPWVETAGVELVFPSSVEVTIAERIPVAWVPMGTQWGLIAGDGVVVKHARDRDEDVPVVQMRAEDPGLGEPIVEPNVLGAVEFLQALPEDVADQTSLRLTNGDIWAWVGDRNVRIGRPLDMAAKAGALVAILDSAPPGVIDVIAPTRPAVWEDPDQVDNPQPEVEGESESFTDG